MGAYQRSQEGFQDKLTTTSTQERSNDMKEVYNHQEIGTLIDQGKPVAFTRQLEVRVTAVRSSPESDTITALIRFCKGDYLLGELENEYPTRAALLKVFAIGELEDIWEVLDGPGIGIL